LGTGFRDGVFLSDLRVVNLPTGQPTLDLHGGALVRLNKLIPSGFSPRIALTLTDEYPYAFAMVIISAEPLGFA
jgi:holo-[acyl-carrier protein] synthase